MALMNKESTKASYFQEFRRLQNFKTLDRNHLGNQDICEIIWETHLERTQR